MEFGGLGEVREGGIRQQNKNELSSINRVRDKGERIKNEVMLHVIVYILKSCLMLHPFLSSHFIKCYPSLHSI